MSTFSDSFPFYVLFRFPLFSPYVLVYISSSHFSFVVWDVCVFSFSSSTTIGWASHRNFQRRQESFCFPVIFKKYGEEAAVHSRNPYQYSCWEVYIRTDIVGNYIGLFLAKVMEQVPWVLQVHAWAGSWVDLTCDERLLGLMKPLGMGL